MSAIVDVIARELLDSRGNPTVEADVELDATVKRNGFPEAELMADRAS